MNGNEKNSAIRRKERMGNVDAETQFRNSCIYLLILPWEFVMLCIKKWSQNHKRIYICIYTASPDTPPPPPTRARVFEYLLLDYYFSIEIQQTQLRLLNFLFCSYLVGFGFHLYCFFFVLFNLEQQNRFVI